VFSVMYDMNLHASQFSRNYSIEHMFTSECSIPVSMYCLCEAKLVPLASLLFVHKYIYIYTGCFKRNSKYFRMW
jgi:hypothetical protein